LEYFVNKREGSYSRIVHHIQEAFIQRGWSKRYSKKVDLPHGVIKRIMAFDGKWRDIYLEIITYDFAKNYILKPSGTIITVLSGYKKVNPKPPLQRHLSEASQSLNLPPTLDHSTEDLGIGNLHHCY